MAGTADVVDGDPSTPAPVPPPNNTKALFILKNNLWVILLPLNWAICTFFFTQIQSGEYFLHGVSAVFTRGEGRAGGREEWGSQGIEHEKTMEKDIFSKKKHSGEERLDLDNTS